MSEGTGGELAQIFHDMGQHCEIKRVDKNKKVIGEAKPEEFEQEVNRAQRMGTVAGGLKGLSRAEKMQWALDVKDQANEFYRERRFKEAATAYQDCLLGLDFGSNEEQANESKMKLQLPIVLNLAACFLEQGAYFQAAEVSKLATEVDPTHPKGWFRRGLAHWRLENAYEAKPHFEQAVKLIESQAATPVLSLNFDTILDDVPLKIMHFELICAILRIFLNLKIIFETNYRMQKGLKMSTQSSCPRCSRAPKCIWPASAPSINMRRRRVSGSYRLVIMTTSLRWKFGKRNKR